MNSVGERLREHWVRLGLEVRPGVTPGELSAFEAKHSVVLPDDLRASLLVANGVLTAGPDWYRFHSVSEFEPWPNAGGPPGSLPFVFADFMIECYAYVIALSSDARAATPVLITAGDGRLESVAPSYTAFVDAYLEYPDNVSYEAIIGGWPPLMCAARNGDVERVRRLLAEGVDPNGRNKDGETALTWAKKLKHQRCVGILEKAGATP